ncbi:MAG: imidazoleglycerol-phosphate dehydratase HisB [bacterium]
MMRKEEIVRETKETRIRLNLNLDGGGESNIKTSIPFFDHLLSLLSHHSMFDLDIEANGDLPHHIIEDIGICLGEAFNKTLGNKKGINRYADITIPMDEALVIVSLDISGRPNLVIKRDNIAFEFSGIVDGLDTSLIQAFLKAFVDNSKITLHIVILYGSDTHHIIEAIFKGIGRVLKGATRIEREDIPSSKGMI